MIPSFVILDPRDVASVAGKHQVRVTMAELVGDDLWAVTIAEGLDGVRVAPVVEGRLWKAESDRCTLVRSEGR